MEEYLAKFNITNPVDILETGTFMIGYDDICYMLFKIHTTDSAKNKYFLELQGNILEHLFDDLEEEILESVSVSPNSWVVPVEMTETFNQTALPYHLPLNASLSDIAIWPNTLKASPVRLLEVTLLLPENSYSTL